MVVTESEELQLVWISTIRTRERLRMWVTTLPTFYTQGRQLSPSYHVRLIPPLFIIMEKQKCEFEHNGKRCEETNIVGIARCKHLCKTHFNTVRRDNVRRFQKDKDIPKELIFTRGLRSSETWSRFGGILKDERRREEKWE